MTFGFLLFPSQDAQLFATQLQSAITRFQPEITPVVFRGRKRKYERHSLEIYRGDTETFVVQVTFQNSPYNLVDWTISAQIREKPDQGDPPIFQSDIVDSVQNNVFSSGHIVWVVPKEITAVLPMKSHFDIRAEKDNVRITLCSGVFERVDDVTR